MEPAESTAKKCKHCRKQAVYNKEDRCRACNHPAVDLASNVRYAEDHIQALGDRYREAWGKAAQTGVQPALKKLEKVAKQTVAVVNLHIDWASGFFNDAKLLYTSYGRLVDAEVRAPAGSRQDRQRTGVEGVLYGSHGDFIAYAALSGDGRGLTSYGPVHLELDSIAVGFRATVLEENSYNFVKRHRIVPGDPTPLGYLALWKERHKLAIAKLTERVRGILGKPECCQLLLVSTGGRDTDDFLEVHIYGTFNHQAVKSVKLSQPESAEELTDKKKAVLAVRLGELQETLDTLGIQWSWA